MSRRVCTIFLLIIFTFNFTGICYAEGTEPLPIVFKKSGGGQYIYCNNPEYITEKDLSTIENPNATYMLKNEGLKPDHYSVFFCFYNWTDLDVEPDIEFITKDNAVITIDSIGYYIPQGSEFWDCIGAWSDLMDINIRTLNGTEQYVPYRGKKDLPKKIQLNNSSDWISKYIYNYDAVKPRSTFNMLVNFTIESGKADVNFAALKSYGIKGDRSWHNPDAKPGQYVRDTSIKGIESESLPRVEADLNVQISSAVKNGESVNVAVYNQFFNNGNIVPHWMTNINPSRDDYMFSKGVAVGSDMLSFAYKDDSKLSFYGSGVPVKERDNIWHFDIYHHDTKGYEKGMPWAEDKHVPNAFTSKTLDINKLPNTAWEFNLGNFGVTNRYNLTIKNTDKVERVLNYLLETSYSSNIVIVRDEAGNMLNPYTLKKTNAFALSKGINSDKVEECMFSAAIPPGATKKFILDVILPTNCFGGMMNTLKVDDHKYLVEPTGTAFPDYSATYQYKNVFYNGERNMKWENGELYQYNDKGYWEHIVLPGGAKKIFGFRGQEFKIIKTPGGYAARFAGWDTFGANVSYRETQNKVYFFDKKFNYINSIEFPYYIYDLAYIDHAFYVTSDKIYTSADGKNFLPLESGFSFPVSNGKVHLTKKSDAYYMNNQTNSSKIYYESRRPQEIHSTGNIFYYKKSWKSNFTDTSKENILSVSADGIYWTDLKLPNKFLELMNVNCIDNKIYVDCKYEVLTFDNTLQDNGIKIKLNNEFLAFDVQPKTVEGRTMVPLRFFFEKLGAKVTWNGEKQEINVVKDDKNIVFSIDSKVAVVNGEEKTVEVPPYIENDKTMIPTRFLVENLGYNVQWDGNANIVEIFAVK